MSGGTLRFSSCHAEIAESFSKALAAYIGRRLGAPAEFVAHIPWQQREAWLDRGAIHVCWLCGLPYVRKNRLGDRRIELLAAPVMSAPRYRRRPIYYSDVVVHAQSPFLCFEDLRGASWGYNDRGSHSGYNLVRYHLVAKGVGLGYFGRVVESGSHQESLRMILERSLDGAAIDSTVLGMVLGRSPWLKTDLRTIAVLGPSPAPPWVVHSSVPKEIRQALRREFLSMDKEAEGRRILQDAGMLRFAAVWDRDYDPIRAMERRVASMAAW